MGDLVRVPESEGDGSRKVETGGEAVGQVHLHGAIGAVDVAMKAGEDLSTFQEDPGPEHPVDLLAPALQAPQIGVAKRHVQAKLLPGDEAVLAAGQERAARGVARRGGRSGSNEYEDD